MSSLAVSPLRALRDHAPKQGWKTISAVGVTVALALVILSVESIDLFTLPILGWSGLVLCCFLFLVTLGASRFTMPVKNIDGVTQVRKSVADAYIFLAAMLYWAAPAHTLAPAIFAAAIAGFFSSYRRTARLTTVFAASTAVISTFAGARVYSLLVSLIAGVIAVDDQNTLPFGALLLPLGAFALIRYALSTLAASSFAALETGEMRLTLSPENLVWTAITELAGAASALLFYSTLRGAGIPFTLVGILISAMVYLLYRFNEQRLEQLKCAEEAKSNYLQQIADLHMKTIQSLAIAIDAKDQTTHGHVRRTQIYATEMGRLLSVTGPEIQALTAGALLHDIGKLAVPEYILNKPGKLTQSEFAKMKIHPTVGGDILRCVGFPYPVEDIVRYHHEKWDGTGYPKGLKGTAIPLVARIISVVDFYDATRCDRPYRKGMTREDSLALLSKMSGTSFDPRIVEVFAQNVEEFDRLIATQDIQEQVTSAATDAEINARPDAGLAADTLGAPDDASGFRSITEAQREVFALHEIAQTVGSSLNLRDTVALVSSKLRAIVPFDTCIIFLVEEKSGKAQPAHVVGEHADVFARRRMTVGDGITGWVIANSRSMCNASPELDLTGIPDEVAQSIRGVLVSPLVRENGAFGAITLYSRSRTSYTTEHVRLLESVCQHASSALNNALTFERTRDSALNDPVTDLPNARAFYMMLEQRLAEGQRNHGESLSIISIDIDDFRMINDTYGHVAGDRMLAEVAAVIRKELRQMDVLARYAGDEFVAIMPMASASMAQKACERIRDAVAEAKFMARPGRTVALGISFGVSSFPEDGITTEALLTAAARNMQRDKYARKMMLASESINIASTMENVT